MKDDIVAIKVTTDSGLTSCYCNEVDCLDDLHDILVSCIKQGFEQVTIIPIREDNGDDQFGEICSSCHRGIGGYWYECAFCHCLINQEQESHMCDELQERLEEDPDFLSFAMNDEIEIREWDTDPIPD